MKRIPVAVMLLVVAPGLWGAEYTYVCPRVDSAPTIDGRLTESVWFGGTVTHAFRKLRDNRPVAYTTLAVLVHDDTHLYVGVLMRKDPGEKLQPDRLFSGDTVEVFLDPGRTRRRYYQLAASTTKRFAAACAVDKPHDTQWPSGMRSAARALTGAWALEMAIPFAPLGGVPKPGDAWGFNVCRTDPTHGLQTFAPVWGAFHRPTKFARLVFGKAKPCVPPALPAFVRADQDELTRLLGEVDGLLGRVTASNPGHRFVPRLRAQLDAITSQRRSVESDQANLHPYFHRQLTTWACRSLLTSVSRDLLWRAKLVCLFE